ncbi:MAG TPA: PAS domain-containing protein, partial [Nitrospira sp.]|nr:PAS domain-containing protein [Nitrospira sp.]
MALTRTIVALRESEERFRTFLDHSPKLAFVKGTDGRYLYVNRRFEEAFHIPTGGALGKTDIELFPRAQAEQFQTHDRQVLESGVAKEFEEVAWQADGF